MKHSREHWTGQFGFLMAAVGSAIGLGILWKFPYVVGENGGGLFLLSYLVCLLVVGVPLLIAEILLGRSSQQAAVSAYAYHSNGNSNWKALGYLSVIASFLIMSFYSVIAGWGMSYVVMSLNGMYQNSDSTHIQNVYQTLITSGDITVFWHFLFTIITTGIVLSGVRKGIERYAKIMTKALLALLLILVCYTSRLDGFVPACRFIFYPNTEHFTLNSVIEALGLAFWTLSIGQGIMISYGSYMKRSSSVVGVSGVVAMSVIVVAILASLVIFPVVFTFGLPPEAGPGLIFQTLPYLFSQLPGALILSTMFFVLFVFTALTSAIPLIEVVATNLMETKGFSRRKSTVLVGLLTFVFGIPSAYAYSSQIFPEWTMIYGMNFLKTIDTLVSTWLIPIGGLFTSIFVGWVMQGETVRSEFLIGTRARYLYHPWRFFIRWVVPCTILLIIFQKSGIYNFNLKMKGF